MNDDKLQLILKRAAEDKEFRARLLNDRQATVDQLDLSEAEKNMLKTVSGKQLLKMIDCLKPFWQKPIVQNTIKASVVGTAAALALTALTSSAGCTASSTVARVTLSRLHIAEMSYYAKYGTYTDIDSLIKLKYFKLNETDRYQYEIKVANNDFAITAKHKTKSNRPLYQVDSKGNFKEIKP
jgi:hypothetical protein